MIAFALLNTSTRNPKVINLKIKANSCASCIERTTDKREEIASLKSVYINEFNVSEKGMALTMEV